jgi:hypothetical protein
MNKKNLLGLFFLLTIGICFSSFIFAESDVQSLYLGKESSISSQNYSDKLREKKSEQIYNEGINDYLNQMDSIIMRFVSLVFEKMNAFRSNKGNDNAQKTIINETILGYDEAYNKLKALTVPVGCEEYHSLLLERFNLTKESFEACISGDVSRSEQLGRELVVLKQKINNAIISVKANRIK